MLRTLAARVQPLIAAAQRTEAEADLLSAGLWSLVVRGAGSIVTFVLGVILARSLGPGEFGVYGIVISLALLLSVAAQAGLPTLSTKEVAIATSRENWALLKGVIHSFGKFVAAASAFAGLCLAAVAVLRPGLFGGNSQPYLVGAVLVPLFAVTVLVAAEIRGFGRTVLSQSLELFVRPGLSLICIGAYLTLGRLTSTYALGLTAAAAALTLAFGLLSVLGMTRGRTRGVSPAYDQRAWARAAWPLALVEILRQVEGSYGILLLGLFASDEFAGFFRLAFSITLIVATPLGVFHMIMAPTLAKLSAGKQLAKLQRVLAISAVGMFFSMALASAALLVVGRPLIVAIFGTSYAGAWAPLMLLMAAQTVTGFFGVGSILLAMGGGERELTLAYAVSLLVAIAASIPLILAFGATGAAAAALLGAPIQSGIVWRAIKVRFGIDCSLAGAISGWRRR